MRNHLLFAGSGAPGSGALGLEMLPHSRGANLGHAFRALELASNDPDDRDAEPCERHYAVVCSLHIA